MLDASHTAPSPTADNGRGQQGQFSAGNKFAIGNPHATTVGKLRSAMLNAVSEEDIKAIVLNLVSMAKSGDLAAMKLLLDRTVGKFVDQLGSFKKNQLDRNKKPDTPIDRDDIIVEGDLEESKRRAIAYLYQQAAQRDDAGQAALSDVS